MGICDSIGVIICFVFDWAEERNVRKLLSYLFLCPCKNVACLSRWKTTVYGDNVQERSWVMFLIRTVVTMFGHSDNPLVLPYLVDGVSWRSHSCFRPAPIPRPLRPRTSDEASHFYKTSFRFQLYSLSQILQCQRSRATGPLA